MLASVLLSPITPAFSASSARAARFQVSIRSLLHLEHEQSVDDFVLREAGRNERHADVIKAHELSGLHLSNGVGRQ